MIVVPRHGDGHPVYLRISSSQGARVNVCASERANERTGELRDLRGNAFIRFATLSLSFISSLFSPVSICTFALLLSIFLRPYRMGLLKREETCA